MKNNPIRYLEKPICSNPSHDSFAETGNMDSHSLPSKGKVNDDFDGIVYSVFKKLMPHFAAKVSITEHELEKRFSRVGVSMIPSLNGFAFSNDNWRTFEIYLCEPLMLFFYQMSKLLASRMEATVIDKGYKRSPISIKTTVSLAKKLIRSFWENKELLVLKKELPIERFNEDQFIVIGSLIDGTERFCVAHELGHVAMKLCSTNLIEFKKARAITANLLNTEYIVNGADKDLLLENWAEEFAADIIGLQLSMNSQVSNIMKGWAYIGAESTFLMINMLEDYHIKKTGVYPSLDEHPPCKARILNLRTTVSNPDLTEALEISRDLERTCNNLLPRILPRKFFWLFAD